MARGREQAGLHAEEAEARHVERENHGGEGEGERGVGSSSDIGRDLDMYKAFAIQGAAAASITSEVCRR